MPQDATLFGIVIPGVVAAIVSALWTLATQRSLSALESRLCREEEGFRLAQSPRVRAAVALWTAFGAFERAVRDLVAPYYPLDAPDDADGAERRERFLRHEREAARAVRAAHRKLVVARAEAECLLPVAAFATFEAVHRAVSDAGDRYWSSRSDAFAGPERAALRADAARLLAEAEARRSDAVGALRDVIATAR